MRYSLPAVSQRVWALGTTHPGDPLGNFSDREWGVSGIGGKGSGVAKEPVTESNATGRGSPPWPPLRSLLTMRSWDDFRPSASKMGRGPMIDSPSQNVGGGLDWVWRGSRAGWPLGVDRPTIFAATRQNNELLTVTLPYSEAAHLRLRQAQRARSQAMWVAMTPCGSLCGSPLSDN